jgi:hypothetical protein
MSHPLTFCRIYYLTLTQSASNIVKYELAPVHLLAHWVTVY